MPVTHGETKNRLMEKNIVMSRVEDVGAAKTRQSCTIIAVFVWQERFSNALRKSMTKSWLDM